jgi:two-component system, chemotaxis family, protein-glutamate methylesterase/glutaminase
MPRRNIVVIGASAGGLEVLQTVLSSLPFDFPGSVFVVLHTSEDSPGLLPEILNRTSRLPVLYAVHNAPILAARVYVAPVGQRHMLLDRGKILLQAGPRENRNRPSIDGLFRSASYAYGNQVLGVILTGNLDDGSAGLADIKTRGGLAIAQDPEEAMAPSMPTSAIESTDIDFVLPAEEIGPKLVELASSEVAGQLQPISNGGRKMAASGQTYACPECGGVLQEVQESNMLRFRCRVGHMYSPESLMADQTEAVETALWAAIRSMEEQAEFSERLAENSRQKNRVRLARRFSEKAQANRENASKLRQLLQKSAEELLEVPDERTGTG